jgi:DNA-binding NarL/FixJ family response regulator
VTTLRVVIADDHPCYRRGLARLLTESGIEVTGEAGNGLAALEAVASAAPDVVLLDLKMPGLSGAEVARRLTAGKAPHRVIILSVSASEADVRSAVVAGASGYFLKDGPVDDIVAGVRAVAAGECLFSPRIASVLLRRIREREDAARALSKREREVLSLMVEGRSNDKIGEGLRIDPVTARNHVSHILSKLHVDNRVQAAVRATHLGLV